MTGERSLRGQLTAGFIEALASDWEAHGQQVLARVRQESPGKYAELVAKLVPAEVIVTEGSRLDGMSKGELMAHLAERMSFHIEVHEEMLKQAKKLAKEREAALPPEDETNRRSRIAREQRQASRGGAIENGRDRAVPQPN